MAKDLSVLVIDNNPSVLEDMERELRGENVRVLTAQDPWEGLNIVYREQPHLVITALVMSQSNGIEILDRVIAFDPSIDVILMTAYPSAETTVEAIRHGAIDYLPKPVSADRFKASVKAMLRARRDRLLASRPQARVDFPGIVGQSALMQDVYSRIERIAPLYSNRFDHR